jgi:hypothetical protein
MLAAPSSSSSCYPLSHSINWLAGCPLCNVFLFFVMRRLLDIQGQLFETRALAKEAAMQQQQLLDSQPSGAPASEQQHMLSKLNRAVSHMSGDDEAAAAAVRAAKLQ